MGQSAGLWMTIGMLAAWLSGWLHGSLAGCMALWLAAWLGGLMELGLVAKYTLSLTQFSLASVMLHATNRVIKLYSLIDCNTDR